MRWGEGVDCTFSSGSSPRDSRVPPGRALSLIVSTELRAFYHEGSKQGYAGCHSAESLPFCLTVVSRCAGASDFVCDATPASSCTLVSSGAVARVFSQARCYGVGRVLWSARDRMGSGGHRMADHGSPGGVMFVCGHAPRVEIVAEKDAHEQSSGFQVSGRRRAYAAPGDAPIHPVAGNLDAGRR